MSNKLFDIIDNTYYETRKPINYHKVDEMISCINSHINKKDVRKALEIESILDPISKTQLKTGLPVKLVRIY